MVYLYNKNTDFKPRILRIIGLKPVFFSMGIRLEREIVAI